MLLGEFRAKSRSLIQLWIILLTIRLSIFVVSVILQPWSSRPSTWIWEYLTLVRGESWAVGWLVGNIALTAVDFAAGFRVHRENGLLLRRTHSSRELIVLRKMYRNLKFVLIFMVLAIFFQMLHGFLWWITCAAALLCKFFYYRELIHLDPRREHVGLLARLRGEED